MARVLNNEIDILNIASLDNDIKDAFTRAMITEDVNTTSAAARKYLEGEYFIHNDRYLYKALEDIAAGTTITPDVNAEVVTVSEELVKLFAQSPEGIFEILSNVESTERASRNYLAGEQIIWTDKLLYTVTTDVVSGGLWEVGTNLSLSSNLTSQIKTLSSQAANKVLYFTGVACAATTGNFTSYSNSAITANHVVSECVFANPSAITTDVTWTTANGSVTLNGTCTTATTINLVLVKKDN